QKPLTPPLKNPNPQYFLRGFCKKTNPHTNFRPKKFTVGGGPPPPHYPPKVDTQIKLWQGDTLPLVKCELEKEVIRHR
ncbi:MAG: hypothetical protein AAGD25_39615, partial [Cyanobacteria bacterium P01_F01_bin.150]